MWEITSGTVFLPMNKEQNGPKNVSNIFLTELCHEFLTNLYQKWPDFSNGKIYICNSNCCELQGMLGLKEKCIWNSTLPEKIKKSFYILFENFWTVPNTIRTGKSPEFLRKCEDTVICCGWPKLWRVLLHCDTCLTFWVVVSQFWADGQSVHF